MKVTIFVLESIERKYFFSPSKYISSEKKYLYPNLILLNSHFCFSLIQNYKIFFVLFFCFQITNYQHYKKYRSK